MRRPETQYTRCRDVSLAYQVIGEGPFDLLYAHGWLSNVEYAWESPHYARFLTKLGQFSRLIYFDRRGTGMSDREVGAPTDQHSGRLLCYDMRHISRIAEAANRG